MIHLKQGDHLSRNTFLLSLVNSLYARTETDFTRGRFRVRGDTVDIFPAYLDIGYRIIFWDDEIESLESFDPASGRKIDQYPFLNIYPANIFVTSPDKMRGALLDIQDDLIKQCAYFRENGKEFEAKRLEERVSYDIEMMRELGYCSGIENYSRYFDGRTAGSRPFCLLDYFPDDFLMVIDESHVTMHQIRAMYGGDRSRKQTLVEYGFRLPSAMDNRPLKFDEFERMTTQIMFVSATPADYELQRSQGVVVEQVIRPTGLLDPLVEVRPSQNQIDDLLEEIDKRVRIHERVLVTTLTKRMAEELTKYLTRLNVNSRYIHSDVDTLARVQIMRDLRMGVFDVLVGVNLLREGLDLPEVSLVAILDADKEGFLRSERSLTQTAGRAARNLNSRVILYADKTTDSMRRMMEETNRRRVKQIEYNVKHNITPTQIIKSTQDILGQTAVADSKSSSARAYHGQESVGAVADPLIPYLSKEKLQKLLTTTRKSMEVAVKELDFMEAARLRDELAQIQQHLDSK